MEESKSVVPSGAYGIPKWIMKKGMRYEVDDFIVSPPSIDDGGFLRLRYGRKHNHDSSLESTGQDGGMTVEVKDDDTLQFSSDPAPSTTISIGPGGLSVESSPNPTPITTPETKPESPDVHPLLVLPMNFGKGASAAVKEAATRSPESTEVHSTTKLIEKVQALSITTSPTVSSGSTPVTSPFTTPRTSPTLHRKVMGVTMDPPRKISAHSYFCTKKYKDNLGELSETSTIQQDLATTSRPKTIDEVSLPPQALDPNMMGQRRKQRQPKPSTLREMNFWAPTSM